MCVTVRGASARPSIQGRKRRNWDRIVAVSAAAVAVVVVAVVPSE